MNIDDERKARAERKNRTELLYRYKAGAFAYKALGLPVPERCLRSMELEIFLIDKAVAKRVRKLAIAASNNIKQQAGYYYANNSL